MTSIPTAFSHNHLDWESWTRSIFTFQKEVWTKMPRQPRLSCLPFPSLRVAVLSMEGRLISNPEINKGLLCLAKRGSVFYVFGCFLESSEILQSYVFQGWREVSSGIAGTQLLWEPLTAASSGRWWAFVFCFLVLPFFPLRVLCDVPSPGRNNLLFLLNYSPVSLPRHFHHTKLFSNGFRKGFISYGK